MDDTRLRRQQDFIPWCVWRADAEFNFKHALPAIICERVQLAAFERWREGSHKTVLNQVVAFPPVFIADEAEEIIDNATTGGGDLNLFELGGHRANLSR